MSKFQNLSLIAIPVVFFLISFFTLSDYGINWDEPIHFMRGQAYLNYFLTGKSKYDLFISSRPSAYQNRSYSTEYLLNNDSGHPPLNGILAAFSNYVFYQKLNLLGDIESYHLFEILTGALLVFVVTQFALRAYGFFPAVVAGLALSSYPLFFGESHFNIKDPTEAAFFGLTVWAFWESLRNFNLKWLLLSAVSCGIAFGIKFNILSLPIILVPYLLIRFVPNVLDKKVFTKKIKKIPGKYLLLLFFSPLIVITIFYVSWPYLWQHPVDNFMNILDYYKTIGTGINYQLSSYYKFGFNGYPILWILYTTPPFILLLTFLGIISCFFIKDKFKTHYLWLFWFIVPIARVSLPNTAIYGGVRQIMEYIPAMALLSGLGAMQTRKLFLKFSPLRKTKTNVFLVAILILVGFLPQLIILVKLHPNENVYFNSLIGGLAGAKSKNIPSWGNSYGNAYYQAILWINQHAEKNSRLALVQGTGQNIGVNELRFDLEFNNVFWSGINRDGEYLMELTYQDSERAYPLVWEYIDKFLEPVYEVKVDGVAIAKVWKNDLAHTKKEFQKKEKSFEGEIKYKREGKILKLIFDKPITLTRLRFTYSKVAECLDPSGSISTSYDSDKFYNQPERYPSEIVTEKNKKPNTIYYYFNAEKALVISLTDNLEKSCIFNNPYAEVLILD